MSKSWNQRAMDHAGYLEGQMLIAMPGIGDPRFERSVILMCSHDESGAMGIVVNKVAPDVSFASLLTQLAIVPQEHLPAAEKQFRDFLVQFGGPVEPGRGFVLHTRDYIANDSTMEVGDHFAMTISPDVLRAIASGEGPSGAILALGYAGWGPGQLESEIMHNGWLHCDGDAALVFDHPLEARYELALAKLGVDPSMLSSEAGHA